jgi:glycosyltransferase involved in cell wall biosynthesis
VRIAFIVQRYGIEILGGSEYHCRLIAERMTGLHDVDVLTTCARDYITWANEYPAGSERINGVTVHRFPNAHARDIDEFNRYSEWIFHNPHTRDDELSWLEQQGPWCPALLDHLSGHWQSYDAVVFFTYLYAPTVLGLQIAAERSILTPTAHNEPAIHLGIYAEMFQRPKAIAFNTEVEKAFLKATFDIRAVAEETVGCGVDLLAGRTHATRADRNGLPDGPFLLYGGRIDPGKGCDQLLDCFETYNCSQRLTAFEHSRRQRSSWCLPRSRAFRCWRSKAWRSVIQYCATRARTFWSTTAGGATPDSFIPRARNSWSARTCCWPTGICASGWDAMARRMSPPTTRGT